MRGMDYPRVRIRDACSEGQSEVMEISANSISQGNFKKYAEKISDSYNTSFTSDSAFYGRKDNLGVYKPTRR